jgi:glycosyltransferase involved in cell wall biosynthesis
MKIMKILHLSSANSEAGAGIACVRLHTSLLKKNIDSKILFLKQDKSKVYKTEYYQSTMFKKVYRFLLSFLDRSILKLYTKRRSQLFSPGLFGVDFFSSPLVKSADIIHLHWINHAFVDIKMLRSLGKPIVWTMHDCWPFTGGCHYFFDCDGFKTACGNCPVLGSTDDQDLSAHILERKAKFYPKLNINFVAISNWMKEKAKEGILLKNTDVNVIPSGIDCSRFMFKAKSVGRSLYSIGMEETVVLLGAQHLNSPSKGMNLSIEALNIYENKKLTIITFGGGLLTLANPIHKILNLGYISNSEEMASLYSLADVFLCTSVAEGFGMTVAEAQCCGTPSIAFENTGPSDIISHRETGYLAKFMDTHDVVKGLEFCLSYDFDRNQISKYSTERFSIDSCAIHYENLYEQLIDE